MEEQNFEGNVTVNVLNDETPSAQEKEQAVLDQAVESGDIAPESAGYETAEDGTIKINLDAIQEREAEEVPVGEQAGDSGEVVEEVREQPVETPQAESEGLELITEDEQPEPPVQERDTTPQVDETQPQIELPENIQKLVDFMEETGGTVEDYVSLNRDVTKMDPVATIKEYYKATKPYLTDDQIQRQLNKKFYYNDETDIDEVEDKKIAFQEELFKAQKHITDAKDKYYADIKLNRLTPEQREAVEFYDSFKNETEQQQKLVDTFKQRTNEVFNDNFKGFDFKVGDNTYRYKVSDAAKVRDFQSDINNFVGQFVGDDGTVTDAAGYHRAMFAAQNADKLAQHFYEQGRADAIKNSAREANNINMNPRKDASSVTTPSGNNVRVVSGDSMDKLRIRWNK